MDTKMKSLNVKEEDIEEGEAGPKGETLAKDMKSGYGSPPSMKGVGAFNKSLFKSASAAKAGSPCDIKPEKKDSKLVWEDGKSSKEEPIEGFYGESPNKPEDDEDKKKDVKKSLFASAELSKAMGTKPVVKPVRAPTSGELGHTPADVSEMSDSEETVYKPLKFDAKKHVPQKGTMARTEEFKKSLFTSAELSKAAGTLYVPGSGRRAAHTQKRAKEAIAKRPGVGKVRLKTIKQAGDPQSLSIGTLDATMGEEKKQGSKSKSRFLGHESPIPGEFKEVERGGQKYRVRGGAFGGGETKKSITELRYGSQLSRVYDIGKSCGVCGRLSKSCGGDDHAGHSGCCGDCKKSMNSVQWHQSHLS